MSDLANKYQSYRGIPELRDAFANWYQRHFAVELNPGSEILPLIGSKEGIMHVAMSFVQNGDKVLVPNPGYPSYEMTTRIAGGIPVYYDLSVDNNWLPDLETIEKQDLSAVKIMWLNYPHMPTGARANREIFEALVAFAHKHKILLCHDNPYAFTLNEEPMSLLSVKGAREVSLELHSLSKTYNMASWRVGVLAGKPDYINAVMKFKSNMDSGMYRPIQLAAIEALKQGEDWFHNINETYKKRRRMAWDIMNLLGCSYDRDTAGLFVWGRIPDQIDNAETLSESVLRRHKVFITPGHIFGDQGARYLRISLCSKEETYREAMDRMNS
jgi:aspartate/methionine/tyrosine aminotransferase